MENLTKSLDEIASSNRNSNRFSRGGNFRSRRRGGFGRNNNSQRFGRRRRRGNRDLRKRVSIFGLDKSFTNEQLKGLFSEYGRLTRCGLRVDRMGDSRGSGDVQFERHEDALNAIQKINKTTVGNSVVDVRFSNSLRRVNLRRRLRNLRIGRRQNGNFGNRGFRRRERRGGFNGNNGNRKRRVFKRSLGRRRRA